MSTTKRAYFTTAIDYVNGQPHLGHAYEKILTDVMVRARRSMGDKVFFLTGLDEHGQKVQQAAKVAGTDTQTFCDQLAGVWKTFVSRLNLANDDFVRTSEERHKRVVRAVLSSLHAQGHFYKSEYRGFYSAKEETFLTERDRREDGSFDPSWGEVIELVEENWYFNLTDHQAWLMRHIEENPDFIYPENRRNEVLGFLRNNTLEDLCITRPIARMNWGIPLPFDPDYVTYVWFDALLNYITVPAVLGDRTVTDRFPGLAGQETEATQDLGLWPAEGHVIGKDILKFHAVYWPIMLKTMGLPLPRQILVHGWWQKDGQKMSKTTGNIVDPIAVIDAWGVDAFRYYLIRELDIGPDGNWTDGGFEARYHAELANGLGNLVNRSLSMLKRYRDGKVPERSDDLAAEAKETHRAVEEHFRAHRLQAALQSIWALIARANQYVDQTAPFKLAKDPEQAKRLDEVLYTLAEICRILAVLIWPFMPSTAMKIAEQLALGEAPDQLVLARWGKLLPGHQTGTPTALFPRKDR